MASGISSCVAHLYVVVHRDEGPLATGLTPTDAGRAMVTIVHRDPGLLENLWIERFDFVVVEPSKLR